MWRFASVVGCIGCGGGSGQPLAVLPERGVMAGRAVGLRGAAARMGARRNAARRDDADREEHGGDEKPLHLSSSGTTGAWQRAWERQSHPGVTAPAWLGSRPPIRP